MMCNIGNKSKFSKHAHNINGIYSIHLKMHFFLKSISNFKGQSRQNPSHFYQHLNFMEDIEDYERSNLYTVTLTIYPEQINLTVTQVLTRSTASNIKTDHYSVCIKYGNYKTISNFHQIFTHRLLNCHVPLKAS